MWCKQHVFVRSVNFKSNQARSKSVAWERSIQQDWKSPCMVLFWESSGFSLSPEMFVHLFFLKFILPTTALQKQTQSLSQWGQNCIEYDRSTAGYSMHQGQCFWGIQLALYPIYPINCLFGGYNLMIKSSTNSKRTTKKYLQATRGCQSHKPVEGMLVWLKNKRGILIFYVMLPLGHLIAGT